MLLLLLLLLLLSQFTVNENKRNFLVAQGPMEHTCADFWQMIWEQKIQLVLMVTNELVRGYLNICKCCVYDIRTK